VRAALVSCLCCCSAIAQEAKTASDEAGKTLAPVKVTAAPEPSRGREVRLEPLQRAQAKDMADVFADEPSVAVGGGGRSAQRLYFRGIDGNNLNITIDGASQGRSLFQHRGNIGGIDPDLLKRVEVQTGSAGADQGSGALGGSLRFETVDAQDLLETGERFGASLKASYGTVDNGRRVGGTAFGRLQEKLGLLAHFSGEEAHEYKDGNGDRVYGTAGKDLEYFLKLSLLDVAGHSLRASVEDNHNTGLYRWGAGDAGYTESAVLYRQKIERRSYVVDYRYQPSGSKLFDARINLYSNEQGLENLDTQSRTEDRTSGGEIRNTSSFEIGRTRHRLTYGVDRLAQKGSNTSSGIKTGADSEAENTGFFLQERMTAGPLGLSVGARMDRYESDFGGKTVKGDEISPNARLDLSLGGGLSAFVGYGEAVRSTGVIPVGWLVAAVASPTFNQQTGKDSYGKAFQPESSAQREVGLKYEKTGLFSQGDRFQAEATGFRTRLENLIVQIGGSQGKPVTGFYNDDPITAEGYEFRVSWQQGAWRSSLAFAHVDTEGKNGQPVAVTRRVAASTGDRLNFDLRWQARPNLSLGYTLNAVGGLDEGTLDRPGYALHGLQAQWQPGSMPRMTLSLAAKNLFDRQYADQTSISSSGTVVPEPGRDIRLSASYRF